MELREKAGQLPLAPGVYLYKDAAGRVIYVGKAKSLRLRVRSYFSEDKLADVKTGTLISEAPDIDYILVDNEKEALALENNLIKQYKPRFNILLRDDKTYPYIKLTHEKYPRVYVTRRLRKDGATYFGPYFPGQPGAPAGAFHPPPFPGALLQGGSGRGAIPNPACSTTFTAAWDRASKGLTTDDAYAAAVRDVRLFLEGRHGDLARGLRAPHGGGLRRRCASRKPPPCATCWPPWKRSRSARRWPRPRATTWISSPATPSRRWWRSTSSTCATARLWTAASSSGKTRRNSTSRSSSPRCSQQLYLDQQFIPAEIHVPVEFEDREALEELLSEKRGHRVEIRTPQRGQKKALLDLVETNAKHSFDARFRVLKPSSKAIQEALQDALNLPAAPARIECFDISHIQGTDKVASMVVWEDGRMKKADYRKFIIRTVVGNDDFASMREVVTRRYARLKEEKRPCRGWC